MKDKTIGVAMSGGVDSTATALLLRDAYSITGYFMRLDQPDFQAQLTRVSTIAERLGIMLEVIDLRKDFSSRVLDYFSTSYFDGLTPNPCVVCNKEIKFGLFLKAVLARGMDKMATGHYARIVHRPPHYHLHYGLDPKKDQSYFLSRLSQEQLSRIIFPLGEKSKSEIYDYVREHGFDDFEGRESQDVCFLADQSIPDFLSSRHPESVKPGRIVTTDGQEIGTHQGLFRYTIGQRRGLGLPDATPWYVAGIDSSTNRLIVGKPESLYRNDVKVRKLHWLQGNPPDLNMKFTVRIRYSHRGSAATVQMTGDDRATICFDEPQRAITPGQFAVIYTDDEVVGSGIIL